MIIDLSMALDSTSKDPPQSEKHIGWPTRITMLACRDTKALPGGPALSGNRSGQPEVAFGVEETCCPREIQLRRVLDFGASQGDVLGVVASAGAWPAWAVCSRVVLPLHGAERRGCLSALHRSEPSPEQSDDGLRLVEAAGAPEVHVMVIGAGHMADPEDRCLRPQQDLRHAAVTALRERDVKTDVGRTIGPRGRDSRALTVKEPGCPRQLKCV